MVSDVVYFEQKYELHDIVTWDDYIGICMYIQENGVCKNAWVKNNSFATAINNPEFKYDAFDIDIVSLTSNYQSNMYTISFDIWYTFWELNEYTNFSPEYDQTASIGVNLYVNDNLIYIVEEDMTVENHYVYDEKRRYSANFEVENFSNDLVLRFELYSTNSSNQNEYFYYENEYFHFDSREEIINIDFTNESSNKEAIIMLPISFYNGGSTILYEVFTIENLIPETLEPNSEITKILSLTYEDQKSSLPLSFVDQTIEIYFHMPGFQDNFSLYATWNKTSNNTYELVLDDSCYYDLENKILIPGTSTKFLTYYDKVILPLDYANNYGYIQFSFSINTYHNIQFNVEIPLHNKNSYKGNTENSLFKIVETTYIDDGSFDYQFIISGDDLSDSNVTLDDLTKWIVYE